MPGLVNRWQPWVLAALALTFAGSIAYEFATEGRWFGMVLFGIVLPLGGLGEWLLTRGSADARKAADRMLVAFIAALLAIWVIVDDEIGRTRTDCRSAPSAGP